MNECKGQLAPLYHITPRSAEQAGSSAGMWRRSVKSALNLKSEDHSVNDDGDIWACGRRNRKNLWLFTLHFVCGRR